MRKYFLYGALGLAVIGVGITLFGPRHQYWNFTSLEAAQEWDMRGVTVTRDTAGIRLEAQQDAALRLSPLSIPVRDYGFLVLNIKGDRPLTGKLRATVDPPVEGKDTIEMPFQFPPGEIRGAFSLDTIPSRETSISSLYLLFDEGMDFILSSILLEHRSLLADLKTVVASYWTFDVFSPITINLLVGPHLTKDPTHIPFLFPANNVDLSTPSANIISYAILLLTATAAAAFAIARKKPWRSHLLRTLCVTFAVLWVIFDVRMGVEILTYVKKDYDSYIKKPAESRTVRNYGRLYDFASFVAETIPKGASYNLGAPDSWPYLGLLRYMTVPSTPIYVQNTKDALYPLWVFYDVSNLEVRDGKLFVGDSAITSKGSVLGMFDEGSFIFLEEG